MEQLTEEQAIAIYQGGEWKDWTDEDIVRIQLYQNRLCLPFRRFHTAVGHVLGRNVYRHEFANADLLRQEYEGKRAKPTIEEIISLLPQDKVVTFRISTRN